MGGSTHSAATLWAPPAPSGCFWHLPLLRISQYCKIRKFKVKISGVWDQNFKHHDLDFKHHDLASEFLQIEEFGVFPLVEFDEESGVISYDVCSCCSKFKVWTILDVEWNFHILKKMTQKSVEIKNLARWFLNSWSQKIVCLLISSNLGLTGTA